MNLGLVNYDLDSLFKKGYKPNQPLHFMRRDYMARTAHLEQFDEELYKVTEEEKNKNTDKFLIATSEHSLSALHNSKLLQAKDLPTKYADYGTCSLRDADAHGKHA